MIVLVWTSWWQSSVGVIGIALVRLLMVRVRVVRWLAAAAAMVAIVVVHRWLRLLLLRQVVIRTCSMDGQVRIGIHIQSLYARH